MLISIMIFRSCGSRGFFEKFFQFFGALTFSNFGLDMWIHCAFTNKFFFIPMYKFVKSIVTL